MTQYKLPFETIKRKILMKKEAKTNNKLGCKPEERKTDEIINYGIVNINKPQGPTSHQVSAYVQKILNIKKSGHSGTLDPHVHGLLPVALGRATRIVQTLLKSGKEYIGIMHLHKDVGETKLKETIKRNFTGKIKQIPPLKSSVKRVKREREIYYFDILEKDDKDVLFIVGCEAGTYIRKLCLHPQTEILSKNGLVAVSDFYFNPQTIYSLNKGKMIEKNPSATQKLPSPTKLLKIKTQSGIDFIVTSDHKLLISNNEGYKMIEAQNLKTTDYLVKCLSFPKTSKNPIIADLLDDYYLISQNDIKDKCKQAFISKYGSIREMYRKLKLDRKTFLTNSKHAITIRHLKLAGIYEEVKKEIYAFKTQKGTVIKMKSLNEDFFYLLGLIASDGNNTKEKKTARYTRVKFHNKNEELIDKFLETYEKLFPNVPISKKKVKSNLFQLDTANSFLATIAASLGIKSPQKNSDLLPILNSPPKLIKPFIRGYFDGDGSVSVYRKKNICKTTISLHTISYQDAKRLHKMLLKINVSNKIFQRKVFYKKSYYIYEVAVQNIAAEKKFIIEIGTNHPNKLKKFKEILDLKYDREIDDNYYIGIHYKKYIRMNKSNLHRMGGNLNRVLKGSTPITRGFYKKASKIINLPHLDDFIIEKIKSIKEVKGSDYVYDMTVPGTHNFLIETGFISSNCHDLGQKLKVGAHMLELRRTKVGPFNEESLCTLQDLTDAYHFYKKENHENQRFSGRQKSPIFERNDKFLRKIIQPMENAIQHLPKIWVFDTTVDTLCHGADLNIPGISKLNDEIYKDDAVAIMTLKDELIALGKATLNSEEIMRKDKGLAVKTDKVFMEPDVYKL
ncbi:MAG: hypothetical protein IH934_03320 [Nanoarchaeota archaeon]|nr:hypothetical protein [Nanoarchaeota archaeon]